MPAPILQDIPAGELLTSSWLYKMSPLEPGANLLLTGRVDQGTQQEPVAWTYRTSGGGRAFYTSLGHPDDFELPWFESLLSKRNLLGSRIISRRAQIETHGPQLVA